MADIDAGRLNSLQCAVCGYQLQLDRTLLIIRNHAPRLMFCPATGDDMREHQDSFARLLDLLVSHCADFDSSWLDTVIPVPRELLQIAIDDSLAETIQRGFDAVIRGEDVPLNVLEAFAASEPQAEGAAVGQPSPETLHDAAARGEFHHGRFRARHDPTDALTAIDLYRFYSLHARPEDDPWAEIHSNLGNLLLWQYNNTSDVALLEEAVKATRQALGATSENDLQRPQLVLNASAVLVPYASVRSDIGVLREAVALMRRALTISTWDKSIPAALKGNLAAAQIRMYEATGTLSHLVEAITLWNEVERESSAATREFHQAQGGLSLALELVYSITDDDADLTAAERAARKFVQGYTAGSDDWKKRRARLGPVLLAQFRRSGRVQDLDEAIAAYSDALEVAPSESPDWVREQLNLGIVFRHKADATDQTENLVASVVAFEAALSSATPGSIEWLSAVEGLIDGLIRRSEHGEPSAPDRAVSLAERAFRAIDRASQARSRVQVLLARAYRRSFEVNGNAGHLELAEALFSNCIDTIDPSSEPAVLLQASLGLAESYAGAERWEAAVLCLEKTASAAEVLYRSEGSHESIEAAFRQAARFYQLHAYALAKVGCARDAIVALERGRARTLTDGLARDRADLSRVGAVAPNLRDRFLELTSFLRRIERSSRGLEPLEPDVDVVAPGEPALSARAHFLAGLEQQGRWRHELDELVQKIRQLPDLAEFQTPPRWELIAEAVAGDPELPITFVLTTEYGSLALLAHQEYGIAQVDVLWLATYTQANLEADLKTWFIAWDRGRTDFMDVLERVLDSIGSSLMAPIVSQLRAGKFSRVAVVAVGRLAPLPLHAGRILDSDGPRYVSDHLAVTYAPSARSLLLSRVLLSKLSQPDRLLAVSPPYAVGSELYWANEEVEAISSAFPRPNVTILNAEATATRERVLQELSNTTVAHFACHGIAMAGRPKHSGLLMANNQWLTSDELAAQEAGGRLAVLSACESALLGAVLPDEVESLPAALLRAGFAGVIGSLWQVPEVSTMRLMQRVYKYWRDDSQEPLMALRRAQQWLRNEDAAFAHPFFWAGFCITGL